MLALAVPVVFAELGWMTMGLVDTIMVGPLGPEAIGAVGLGTAVFFALAIFGMGLLLGLDALVAQAFGAGDLAECHRWLLQGVALAVALAVPLMILSVAAVASLPLWGFHPDVLRLAVPYLRVVLWSALPLLLYTAFRRYLQAINVVHPVMFALVSANLVNIAANWILIYGRLGAPALGPPGAAWATLLSRIYMAVVLLAAILYHEWRHRLGLFETPLKIEMALMQRLVRLGSPAAIQVTLEVGVFAAATLFAGKLDPAALAAHQIAINLAGFTFMVPLGISSAGAVRVGHAVGRRDPAGVARSGWTAFVIGVLFMACAAFSFVAFPRALLGIFTSDRGVISTGVTLLFVAAIFQLFDGLQGVATGVLRGLGDTRTAMIWNLAGHWLVGLPLGYSLCFIWRWGVAGLWVGLSSGLIAIGIGLLAVWTRRVRQLELAYARA